MERLFILGVLAQLGERGLCKPEVRGSSPLYSTIYITPLFRAALSYRLRLPLARHLSPYGLSFVYQSTLSRPSGKSGAREKPSHEPMRRTWGSNPEKHNCPVGNYVREPALGAGDRLLLGQCFYMPVRCCVRSTEGATYETRAKRCISSSPLYSTIVPRVELGFSRTAWASK